MGGLVASLMIWGILRKSSFNFSITSPFLRAAAGWKRGIIKRGIPSQVIFRGWP